jgi:hypothetical protein
MDYEKAAQLLSIPGVLSRLYRAYAVETSLTQRMLRKLPDGLVAQRGEIPDRIHRIEARATTEPTYGRFLYYSPDWAHDLSLSIRRSLRRYKVDSSQIEIVVESPTSAEKSIRIALKQDLTVRLWLQQHEGSMPVLNCAIDKTCRAAADSAPERLIHDALAMVIVKRCLPYSDIFYAEPTRLVADRIAEIIARSFMLLGQEKSEACARFKTVGRSDAAFGFLRGL